MSDLPNGWTYCKLSDVTKYRKGTKPKILITDKRKDFVPYIDIRAFEKNDIRQYADIFSSKLSTKDDILVVWDGARCGLVGTGKEGAIGSTIMCLSPKGVAQKYLYYFLITQYDEINSNNKGTGIPHVKPEIFWNIELPIAPINEQKRIVAKLDILLSKVDTSKARLDAIPHILKRFRQSVLSVAVSGELTQEWRGNNPGIESSFILLRKINKRIIESNFSKLDRNRFLKFSQKKEIFQDEEDENNSVPNNWVSCQIGNIGIVCNGSTPSRKISDFWNGSISWVSSGEVKNNHILFTRESISELGFKNSSVRILPKGTVLLAMIGEGKTRGQSAILNIEATINQNVAAVIINHGYLVPQYLWLWFQFRYEKTRNVGSGSGPQALNCERVRELPFNLPPLKEQKEIVRRVEQLFKFADKIEARYNKAKQYADRLTQSILAKAFRGELVMQDPDDEPAEKLLERIKSAKKQPLKS